MNNQDREIMLKFLSRQLIIRSEVAYPDSLDILFPEKFEGSDVFEKLIPGILETIVTIIHNETLSKVSGSNLMQARLFKTMISKRYDHLKGIIGIKRWEKYVDFPRKVQTWRNKNLPEKIIRKRLVESIMSLYLTAAKRDPVVFQSELLPNVREAFRPEFEDLDPIQLDALVRDIFHRIDVGRAKIETKELVKDLQTYCMIIFFINRFKVHDIVLSKVDIVPILDVIRKEFEQISHKLIEIDDVKEKINRNR